MPKSISVKKRARQSQKKKQHNLQMKTRIKGLIKKVEKSTDWDKAIENLKQVTKALDKAVKLKVIHKNKAARTKSQLTKIAHLKKKKAE